MPPLVPPKLDDRSYEDLRRELIRRIPVHSQTWTDHNASDPGITLLELFAWLGENLLRRMDQVPQNSMLEFFRLLGLPLRPATAARAWAQFSLPKGALDAQILPLDPLRPRCRVAAGRVEFQVTDELMVLPLEGMAVVKLASGGVDKDTETRVSEILAAHLGEAEGSVKPSFYETLPLADPKAGVLGAPVSLTQTQDRCLWVALLASEAALKVDDLHGLRQRLAQARAVISVAIAVDEGLAGASDAQLCPAPGSERTIPETRWQISTGLSTGTEPARIDSLRYDRLLVVSDGTEGLSRSGVVRLQLPLHAEQMGTWALTDEDDNDLSGAGDLPPALNDAALEGRVLAWLRVFRTDAPHPAVRWAGVNVVEVEQALTMPPELLGSGTGQPGQVLRLSRAPVLSDSVVLEVREPEPVGWVLWSAVPNLALSRGDDPHYVLDAATGEVRFGDGVNGRAPRLGEPIRVRTWRSGGGAAGNVAAGAISRVSLTPEGTRGLKVTNPLAGKGGRDGETEAEAKARLPQELRHNDRAVGMQDFRDVTMGTPGVTLGRVHVLPRHKPPERVDEVPGVVTLVVIPAWDPENPDEPMPDKEQIRKICAHLEPRRLVTTELYISGPEYVPVWLSIAIEVKDGYGIATVRRWVELGLRQHFAPLPPYGPAGEGWPFGREIRLEDVIAAALQVEGVRLVTDARLEGEEIDAGGTHSAVTLAYGSAKRALTLNSWQIPSIKGVQIVEGDQAEAVRRDGDSPPDTDGTVVAAPVVKEKC